MLFGSRLMSNLHSTLAAAAGVQATYRRGGAWVELTIVRGAADDNDYGVDEGSIVARTWAFLVKAEDLVLSGAQTLPQIGDEIELVEGETTVTYRVVNRAGERCYRFSDTAKHLLRIYAVQE